MTVYEKTADELVNRILVIAPENKEKLLTMEDPFELFKINGFSCSDIEPSFAQACWALQKAKEIIGQ